MLQDRNTIFRGYNLTVKYNISDILDMIHSYRENDLFIGDYIIVNKISFRFAYFDPECKYAILVPDRIIGKSKHNFIKIIQQPNPDKSWVNTKKIPQILEQYPKLPILYAKQLSIIDINRLPLFKMKSEYIIEHFNNPYSLSDVHNKFSYKYVNENGKISIAQAMDYMGIRPMVYIGYSIIRRNNNDL